MNPTLRRPPVQADVVLRQRMLTVISVYRSIDPLTNVYQRCKLSTMAMVVVATRVEPAWIDEARRALMLGDKASASLIIREALLKCIGDGDMEPDTNTDTHESAA